MAKIIHKHKTIGVSFNPQLRQRASRRARELGMSFSRYVSLCVEAEGSARAACGGLRGVQQGNTPRDEANALAAADGTLLRDMATEDSLWQGMGSGRPAELVDERLFQHVRALLKRASLRFEHRPQLGPIRTDFLVYVGRGQAQVRAQRGDGQAIHPFGDAQHAVYEPSQDVGGGEVAHNVGNESHAAGAVLNDGVRGAVNAMATVTASAVGATGPSAGLGFGASEGLSGVAIECCHPVDAASTVILGRAVMLQQVATVEAVLLCVPYLSTLATGMQSVFDRQNIYVTTPDTLLQVLNDRYPHAL